VQAVGTNRLEAFSDGVIAVAITLLVLDLRVPEINPTHRHSLVWLLGQNWPNYAAYVTSFLTIGIIWINHHAMIGRLREADHSILILNLLLLMSISALPFATALMAAYLREPTGESVAAAVYSGAFLLMAFFFGLLNRHILLNRAHLLSWETPLEERHRIYTRAAAGLVPYVVATILAFVSPYITLAICAALAAYYALPTASGLDRPT
jgi:uncharacterized membrane protein